MATRKANDFPIDEDKPTRLSIRITQEQKMLFQRAAEVEKRTLTDFVVTHLERIAAEALRNGHRIVLSPSDSEMFVRMLLNPPEPNENLRKAFADSRRTLVVSERRGSDSESEQ